MNGDRFLKNIRVPFHLKESITNSVIKKLGVKDLFQLRDRFDGDYYLKKQLNRIISSYIAQKVFDVKLLDDDKPLWCESVVQLNNHEYTIVSTLNVNRIKIPNSDKLIYLVVFLTYEHNKRNILGVITRENCKKLASNDTTSNSLVAKDIITVVSKENLQTNLHD